MFLASCRGTKSFHVTPYHCPPALSTPQSPPAPPSSSLTIQKLSQQLVHITAINVHLQEAYNIFITLFAPLQAACRTLLPPPKIPPAFTFAGAAHPYRQSPGREEPTDRVAHPQPRAHIIAAEYTST